MAVAPSCIKRINRAVYRELAEQYRIEVTVVVPSVYAEQGRAIYPEESPAEPFNLVQLEPIGGARLYTLKGLRKLIKESRPTHVLLENGPASRLALETSIWAPDAKKWAIMADNRQRDFRKDVVCAFFQGRLFFAASAMVASFFWRTAAPRMDHVFVLSQDAGQVLANTAFRGGSTLLPLGFDPRLFYPMDEERRRSIRLKLGLKAATIAYFGRMQREKGVHHLLEVLGGMKDFQWQLMLDTFGSQDTLYTRQLKGMIASEEIGDRIVYFEATHEEIPEYMNGADIVVLPSYSGPTFKEQFGRVVAEAMACGKVVIGSTCGAIPEVIGDGGYLFNEGDKRALAERLKEVLTAPEEVLSSIRRKARARAIAYLSAARQAEILAEAIR